MAIRHIRNLPVSSSLGLVVTTGVRYERKIRSLIALSNFCTLIERQRARKADAPAHHQLISLQMQNEVFIA